MEKSQIETKLDSMSRRSKLDLIEDIIGTTQMVTDKNEDQWVLLCMDIEEQYAIKDPVRHRVLDSEINILWRELYDETFSTQFGRNFFRADLYEFFWGVVAILLGLVGIYFVFTGGWYRGNYMLPNIIVVLMIFSVFNVCLIGILRYERKK